MRLGDVGLTLVIFGGLIAGLIHCAFYLEKRPEPDPQGTANPILTILGMWMLATFVCLVIWAFIAWLHAVFGSPQQ